MKERSVKYPWINPIGGLGDALMLSGILKKVYDKNPGIKYNLVRRNKYTSILDGHPAIAAIGHPPKDAEIIKTDYWSMEKLGGEEQRAYQILARYFGLKTPVKEDLYLPGHNNNDKLLHDFIPWKEKNIILSPSSESPRKEIPPGFWHQVVEKLLEMHINVLQVGKKEELHIKNTFSLMGLTDPHQLVELIKKADLVATVDNFIMHIAHMVGTPAVVLWGPTSPEVYGYPEHIHIKASLDHCPMQDQCLGPGLAQNYRTPCPIHEQHCMNNISYDTVYKNIINILI